MYPLQWEPNYFAATTLSMDFSTSSPDNSEVIKDSHHLRLLVLSDVDVNSAVLLSEEIVPTSPPAFDLIVVCGPLSQHNPSNTSSVSSDRSESESMAQGEMSAVVAHLENIVCRVVYVPGDQDPMAAAAHQLHLTPNSINIHARALPLHKDLFISGFTEKDVDLLEKEQGHDEDDGEGPSVQCSSSSLIIEEILSQSAASCFPPSSSVATDLDADELPLSPQPPSGIFVFNYKFAHSLNNFLFYQSDLAKQARLRLLVVPSLCSGGGSDGEEDRSRNFEFPRELNGYTIASPRSLRLEGRYQSVELSYSPMGDGGEHERERGGGWEVTDIQDLVLKAPAPTSTLSSVPTAAE